MTIFIYAREEIEQLIEKEFPTKTAVISFYDPPVGSHEAPPADFCGKAGKTFQFIDCSACMPQTTSTHFCDFSTTGCN